MIARVLIAAAAVLAAVLGLHTAIVVTGSLEILTLAALTAVTARIIRRDGCRPFPRRRRFA